MPPWLPEPSSPAFVHARRLSPAQVALFQQWAAAGTPPGDPEGAPPPPVFVRAWPLGKPDQVVTQPRPYLLPAETTSASRAFVLPLALTEDRWLRAIDFRPGNAPVVRHATLYADAAGLSRRLEAQSGAVGYTARDAGLGADAVPLAEWSVRLRPVDPAGRGRRAPARRIGPRAAVALRVGRPAGDGAAHGRSVLHSPAPEHPRRPDPGCRRSDLAARPEGGPHGHLHPAGRRPPAARLAARPPGLSDPGPDRRAPGGTRAGPAANPRLERGLAGHLPVRRPAPAARRHPPVGAMAGRQLRRQPPQPRQPAHDGPNPASSTWTTWPSSACNCSPPTPPTRPPSKAPWRPPARRPPSRPPSPTSTADPEHPGTRHPAGCPSSCSPRIGGIGVGTGGDHSPLLPARRACKNSAIGIQ